MRLGAVQRPLVPEDIGRGLKPGVSLGRAAFAHVLSATTATHSRPKNASEIVRERWDDPVASALVTRAATGPATIATPAWAGLLATTAVGDFVERLAPLSAAAEVFKRAVQIDLAGYGSLGIPARTLAPSAADVAWVAEGGAIPVGQPIFTSVAVGPMKKLAVIMAFTRQLAESSAAETVITQTIRENIAFALDAGVFSNAAATAARPAGILNGITGQTASVGGGETALFGDLEKLSSAISAAVGEVVLVGHPTQIMSLRIRAPLLNVPTFATSAVASGVLIMVDPSALAVAFSGEPRFLAGEESVIHMESATPLDIGTPGSPATVAAPSRSAYQTDSIALRAVLPVTWAVRAAGAISWVTGTTWGG